MKQSKTFPVVDLSVVGPLIHVGTMDISKKNRHSFEGDGLSVSNCPETWEEIGEGSISGEWFRLEKPEAKLLDFYAISDAGKEAIKQWGIENGLVEETTLYKAMTYNGDLDQDVYTLHKTREEALEEVCDEEECVEPVPGLVATQKLESMTFTTLYLSMVFETVVALYAETVLDYDGIYWNEEEDVSAYSAPRGVIFNSKVPSFNVSIQKEEA